MPEIKTVRDLRHFLGKFPDDTVIRLVSDHYAGVYFYWDKSWKDIMISDQNYFEGCEEELP
jgi:hypothetical protein